MTDDTVFYDLTAYQAVAPDDWITPAPLSDPVFTAIFQNAEVSGLAMRSLLNATLEDSGDRPISEVVAVTPQAIHSDTSSRGYRVDVEAKTESGEIALVEVQIKPFTTTVERALLYAEQALASRAKRGDKLEQVTKSMPRVIVVNLLEKALRDTGRFHQIVELLYREPPYQRATEKLMIHNLELDKFREHIKDKPTTKLECWLFAVCASQDENKPLKEVVKMHPELQAFYDEDPGFAQFIDRYGEVASIPEIRKAYRRYEYDQILDALEEERRAEAVKKQIDEGIAEGKAKGKAEGKAEVQMEIALKAFNSVKQDKSMSEIIDMLKLFDIPDDIINEAKRRAGACPCRSV